MLRILADVNIPRATVVALRAGGNDVVWAMDPMATDPDVQLLALAQADTRIVLTNDKDFGELAVRVGLPVDCGVVLLRLSGLLPDDVVQRTIDALSSRDDWAGHFSVVNPQRIRMKPLKPRS